MGIAIRTIGLAGLALLAGCHLLASYAPSSAADAHSADGTVSDAAVDAGVDGPPVELSIEGSASNIVVGQYITATIGANRLAAVRVSTVACKVALPGDGVARNRVDVEVGGPLGQASVTVFAPPNLRGGRPCRVDAQLGADTSTAATLELEVREPLYAPLSSGPLAGKTAMVGLEVELVGTLDGLPVPVEGITASGGSFGGDYVVVAAFDTYNDTRPAPSSLTSTAQLFRFSSAPGQGSLPEWTAPALYGKTDTSPQVVDDVFWAAEGPCPPDALYLAAGIADDPPTNQFGSSADGGLYCVDTAGTVTQVRDGPVLTAQVLDQTSAPFFTGIGAVAGQLVVPGSTAGQLEVFDASVVQSLPAVTVVPATAPRRLRFADAGHDPFLYWIDVANPWTFRRLSLPSQPWAQSFQLRARQGDLAIGGGGMMAAEVFVTQVHVAGGNEFDLIGIVDDAGTRVERRLLEQIPCGHAAAVARDRRELVLVGKSGGACDSGGTAEVYRLTFALP